MGGGSEGVFEKIEIDRVRWLLGVSIVGLPGGTVLGISLRDQATHGIDIQIINLIWLTLICRSYILRIGHYSLQKPVTSQ